MTDATEALLSGSGGPPADIRRAALRWSYSERIRDAQPPPAALAQAVKRLDASTVSMDAFGDRATAAALARAVLTRISQTLDGKPAAANTAKRKRMVINNAMEYACEVGVLTANPLKLVNRTKPRAVTAVDPAVVVSPEHARRFLKAVATHSERGRRLTAFFACMYFAALRPEEVSELRVSNLTLPTEAEAWGEMRLTRSQPPSGSRWTSSGQPRELAPLKHRAKGDVRQVPIHPELVAMLRNHIRDYVPAGPDARLFTGLTGGPVTDRMYLRVFHEARAAAFTEAERESPLMGVPYSLRHAAVSTWLRTTGDPALVASWAGHTVAVLLNVYAKCVHGTKGEALRRVFKATRATGADKARKGTK